MNAVYSVETFGKSPVSAEQVAEFDLSIKQGVEAAGQKKFLDVREGWRELRRLNEVYQAPGSFWVAQTADELVGCVGLKDEGEGHGLVGRFGVAETYRRLGIGRTLMTTLIDYATTTGFEVLALGTNSNQHGLPLYEQLGFVTVGHMPDDGDLRMELRLTQDESSTATTAT